MALFADKNSNKEHRIYLKAWLFFTKFLYCQTICKPDNFITVVVCSLTFLNEVQMFVLIPLKFYKEFK